MNITDAFETGAVGLQRAALDLQSAAFNITLSTTADASSQSEPDLNREIVRLMVAENHFRACAAEIRTVDEALGTLIETLV